MVVTTLIVAVLAACSEDNGGDAVITEAQGTTTTTATATTGEPNSCRYETLFAALAELRGVRAMCPRWLPVGVQPTSLFARSAPPEYVIEFNPPNELLPHLVFQLARGDAPGRLISTADIVGKRVEVYFEQAAAGAAGLHAGHYIAVVPGGGTQRGAYWVSLHQDSQRSHAANIEELLKLVRSMHEVG